MQVIPRGTQQAPPRRVRHEVRDGLLVMGFSLASSLALALGLTVLTRIGG